MPTRVSISRSVTSRRAADFTSASSVKRQIKSSLPPFAPMNLALSRARRGDAAGGFVNHLGIEMDSATAVERHLARVKAAGIATREQLNVNCCYANQSKFWVIDPDGVEWEVYHVNHDLVEKHGGGVEPRREAAP
jgi:hypothetical protein